VTEPGVVAGEGEAARGPMGSTEATLTRTPLVSATCGSPVPVDECGLTAGRRMEDCV
jgi:hypothetical protein